MGITQISVVIYSVIILVIAWGIARIWSHKAVSYIKYVKQLERENNQLRKSNRVLVAKNDKLSNQLMKTGSRYAKLESKLTQSQIKIDSQKLTVNRESMMSGIIVRDFNGYAEQDLMMMDAKDIIAITGVEIKQ